MDAPISYRVISEADAHAVVDSDGRQIMACRDARSAEHYASMLSQAFDPGYRIGYRAAKSTTE